VRGIEVAGIDTNCADLPGCHTADIRDKDVARHIPLDVDAVVHLAALSRDADCRGQALRSFDVNVMGTLNLVEAARSRRARQFIFASSEWVYDRCDGERGKCEDDAIDITALASEYPVTKLVGEVGLRQAYQQGFCPVSILRVGIVYGPRHSNWSAVEALVNAVATEKEVTVGSLLTARRFIHVSDVADAILSVVGLKGLEILNVQGPRLVSLGEIIDMSMHLLGSRPAVCERDAAHPSVRNISSHKIESLLGWRAKIGIAEGVRSVAEFLKLQTA
jgi:UDP-glucose 4-epimerase